MVEFRIFWYGNTYLRARNIGIRRVSWKATELGHETNTGQDSSTPGTYFSYPGQNSPGYVLYGPYTTLLNTGTTNSGGMKHVASFSLATSPSFQETDPIVTLQAYDATTGIVLSSRTLNKSDIKVPSTTQFVDYDVNYQLQPSQIGHNIELRVYWHGTTAVRYKSVSDMAGWWK